MPTTLTLLRHGRTPLAGTYTGSTDVPLSDEGVRQVRQLKKYIENKNFDRVICSPLLRCRQTTAELTLKNEWQLDSRIREVDFGRWEGKTFSELPAADKDLIDDWAHNSMEFTFPQGECIRDFVTRLKEFQTHLEDYIDENILIVTHGGVIRYLLCLLMHWPLNDYLKFAIDEARFSTVVVHDGYAVLTGLNRRGNGSRK